MKHVFFVLCFLAVGCQKSESDSNVERISGAESERAAQESAAVNEAFSEFGSALKRRDGDRAAEFASGRTIEMYEDCRSLAIDSSDNDFADLSQLELLLVFQLRYHLSRGELEAMNGRDVLSWGVDEGMVNDDTVDGITLDRVQIDGDVAFATTIKDGQPSPNNVFRFVKEEDRWKFDLFHIFQGLEPAFEDIRNQARKSKIELAVFLMERKYGTKIPFEILKGPIKK